MDSHRKASVRQLGQRLRRLDLRDPLVLAQPRDGDLTAGILAEELDAEFDVVLARTLRAPFHPELPIGAICDGGRAVVCEYAPFLEGFSFDYLEQERLIRRLRPQARVTGRSVVLVGDGNASSSSLLAVLQLFAAQAPKELILVLDAGAGPNRPAEGRREMARKIDHKSERGFVAITVV